MAIARLSARASRSRSALLDEYLLVRDLLWTNRAVAVAKIQGVAMEKAGDGSGEAGGWRN